MHKKNFNLIVCILTAMTATLMGVSSACAENQEKVATPLKPQDFAYGIPLNFSGQDALYQTTLPLSVYQNTLRGDLGDLRVFNAQGEVVPHKLRQPDNSSLSQPTLGALVFFPLQGAPGSGLDQLSVSIKRNAAGTLINIGSQGKPASSAKLSGYLIDASAIKQSMQALELDWPASSESFVGTLQIENSDNLRGWHTIVHGAPLLNMQFAGHQLLQKRIAFPAMNAKYLRLSWPAEQKPLRLSSINAELAGARIDSPLSWLTVKGSEDADKPGDYQFDLGAHLPLQRVRVELPQMNTLVQAGLFSKARAEDAWRPASNNMLYKLHSEGQDLINPDIAVASNHRYWLLRVEQNSGGLGAGMPQMQVGWHPQQLLFVTRGQPPFQLAYGSTEVKPAEFQIQNLLPSGENGSALKIKTAQTGIQISLGGEERMVPAPLPRPWKKWILWAVLGIAVVLLGWMAYRLVKQMENSDEIKM